jgi:hypothetical protein
MVVTVLSKIGHQLSRRVIGSTLAGDGLLVRLRSTSIGLLGLVAAVCLALVAFVASQGWPEILNSPLPATPPKVSAVNNAVALRPPTSVPPARVAGAGGSTASLRSGRHGIPSGVPSGSNGGKGRLHAAHQVAGSAPPPAPQPAPVPVPSPTAPPSSPAGGDTASTPTPTSPAPTAPVTAVTAPGKSKSPPTDVGNTTTGHGKSESAGHSNAPAKPKSHGASKPALPHHAPAPSPVETAPPETVPPTDNVSAPDQRGNGHGNGKSSKSEH